MSVSYRSSDAVLTICQNNELKTITISDVNEVALTAAERSRGELVGVNLADILPERISFLFNEYVEFEDEGNDIASVLSRVNNFAVIYNNESEKNYRIKIERITSRRGVSYFLLILQNAAESRKEKAARSAVGNNFRGYEVLDKNLGIPDKESLLHDIDFIRKYAKKGDMPASFAALKIDGYEKLAAQNGTEFCDALIKHTAIVISRNLRPDDTVGTLGQGRLGVLLVDVNKGSERIVFNRLRLQVAANHYVHNGEYPVSVTISVGFRAVDDFDSARQIVADCEIALDDLSEGEVNVSIEARDEQS